MTFQCPFISYMGGRKVQQTKNCIKFLDNNDNLRHNPTQMAKKQQKRVTYGYNNPLIDVNYHLIKYLEVRMERQSKKCLN